MWPCSLLGSCHWPPWLAPLALLVPFLFFLALGLTPRYSRTRIRIVLVATTPVLFLLGILLLWSPENFSLDFAGPVAVAGLAFGSWQRIPD